MPLWSWSHTRLTFILLPFPSPPIASFPHFMSFCTSITDRWETNTAPPLQKHTPLAVYSLRTHTDDHLSGWRGVMAVQRTGTLPFHCDGDAVRRDVIMSGVCRRSGFVMEDHRREDQTCTDTPWASHTSNNQQLPSKHLQSQYITPKTSESADRLICSSCTSHV